MKGMKSDMNYEFKNEINVLNIGWLILIFGDSWNLENYKLIFFYYLTKVVEKKNDCLFYIILLGNWKLIYFLKEKEFNRY